MSLLRDPDRYSLPVAHFIRRLMKESFPQFPVGQGSAFGDVFVLPASFLTQRYRDELNVLKRNQSALNFQTMLEEEMNRLAANFFVERRTGVRSFGIVRVFFSSLQPVTIDTSAVFFDDQDHRWYPISSVLASRSEMERNYVADTGEYYVDVAVIAETEGVEYVAEEDQVNQFSGILGASRCTNPNKFSDAKNTDTNTDLYIAIKDSITNNDLVKAVAIRKMLRANFSSIRSVQVVGFGHPAMTRDVVDAVVSLQQLVTLSYAQKFNLPLDANGNVNFFDENGRVVVSPIGGTVGAIVDLTGLDYNAMNVTLDGRITRIISVQPDFRVRMYPAAGVPNDPDEGDYFVTRVEEVPTEPLGTPVKILRLDKPFRDPNLGSFDPQTDSQKYGYSILGPVSMSSFHVGGKIDVYVDSTATSEEAVIVASLSEIVTGSGVGEVPITTEVPLDPVTNLPMFEGGQGFLLPFLGTLKIEQVSADNALAVERTLVEGENYVYIAKASRERFTTADYDVIRIKGWDENDNPLFIGKRLKITYLTNKEIPLMQDFVDNPENRTENTDILIKATENVLLDVSLKYSANLDLTTVQSALEKFILSKPVGEGITAHEIELVLGLVGVTYIENPILLTVTRETGTGQIEVSSSEDKITIEDYQRLYPVDILSVEKIG